MVGTCAIPECSAKFLYLNEGRLYIAPSPDAAIRYLWLCADCAPSFNAEAVALVRLPARYSKPATPARVAPPGGDRESEKAG
jgi:hypothetical protein